MLDSSISKDILSKYKIGINGVKYKIISSLNINNENKLIHDMYFNGYESVIKNIFTDDNTKLLINVLDKLCIMYIKRIVMKQTDSSEQALLDKYQIIVNDMFTKMDQNYFAFCALITTDELREKCMKKFDSKI